jgi:hypothetical protein
VTSSYTRSILRRYLPDILVSSFIVFCSLTSFFSIILFHREWLVRTNVAALSGVRPDSGGMQGHTRSCVCATPAHKLTHALTHAGTHPLHVSVFAQAAFLSLCLPPLLVTCRGNFSCFVVKMVTCVASWYDCMSKQSGYVQLSVREDSEKSAVRNLTGMVSVGLSVLCLLSVLRLHGYFTGTVSLKKTSVLFRCMFLVLKGSMLDIFLLRTM